MAKPKAKKELNYILNAVKVAWKAQRKQEQYTVPHDNDVRENWRVSGPLLNFCSALAWEVEQNKLDQKTLVQIKGHLVGMLCAVDRQGPRISTADASHTPIPIPRNNLASESFAYHALMLNKICKPRSRVLLKVLFGALLGAALFTAGIPILGIAAYTLQYCLIGSSALSFAGAAPGSVWAVKERAHHRDTSNGKKNFLDCTATFFPGDSPAGQFREKAPDVEQTGTVQQPIDTPLLTAS